MASPTPEILLLSLPHVRKQAITETLADLSAKLIELDPHHSETAELSRRTAAVLVIVEGMTEPEQAYWLAQLCELAEREFVPIVAWGTLADPRFANRQLCDCLPADRGAPEVRAHLEALLHCGPVLRRLNRELTQQERLSKQINRYFEQIDHELRLAGRLQRDFLPRRMPTTERLRFASLYRPAVWVSGDIFDIFRVDERHIALFLADAMGHGTAAGLITMVLRKSLVPVLQTTAGPELVRPATVMQQVHDGLTVQDLPHSQFATAAYALVDTETLTLEMARGGHPYALRIDASGGISEITPEGGLLGVPGLDLGFEEYAGELIPGDKLVLYTDGLEPTLLQERAPDSGAPVFTERMREWARLPIDELVTAVGAHLDHAEGSLNPEDDVTLLAMEVVK